MGHSGTIKLVQGDNRPIITLTVIDDANDGDAMDLSPPGTAASVYFRASGTTETLAKIACTFVTDGQDGKIRFKFPDGVLDVPVGAYEAQVEIDFDGEIQTLPGALKFRVEAKFEEPAP